MIEAAFNAYLLTKFVFLKIFRNEKKEALRLKIKNFYFWTFFRGVFSFLFKKILLLRRLKNFAKNLFHTCHFHLFGRVAIGNFMKVFNSNKSIWVFT